MSAPRLAVMRRLAREFVEETIAGLPHRRATEREAPFPGGAEQVRKALCERDRREFLRRSAS